jgi:hypothetical protein
MTQLHRLARAEAFCRVPETCPEVALATTQMSFGFTKWVDTVFAEKLTEAERSDVAGQFNVRLNQLVADIRELSTDRLRVALVWEIEQNLRLSLSQERIDRIEAGEDPEQTAEKP